MFEKKKIKLTPDEINEIQQNLALYGLAQERFEDEYKEYLKTNAIYNQSRVVDVSMRSSEKIFDNIESYINDEIIGDGLKADNNQELIYKEGEGFSLEDT